VRGAILMEDLSSGTNLDPIEVSSREVLTILCSEIGRLHGFTAKTLFENNGKIGGLKPPKAFTYPMCFMTSGVPKLMKRRWTPKSNLAHKVYARWSDSDLSLLRDDPEMMQALLALQQHFMPHVYGLYDHLTKYKCIVQGDFHAGNFMLMPNGQVKMFDMQMWGVGHPAEELCYFLASNVAPAVEHDDLALRMVHNAMETASQGVVKYSYEELRRDVDICTLHYLAASIVRRGIFDTPQSVAKMIEKLGPVMEGIQRVLRAREQRLLVRMKTIWKRNPTFRLGMVKVIQ
jgi:hypothetical protein